jgi:hypothetical protein
MQSLYFWPENPALSIAALWGLSVLFLWAARDPMLQLLRGLTRNLESGVKAIASWCETTARSVQERSRAALDAASELELSGRISREFQRIDAGFSEKLGHYAELHRKLDDLVQKLDADYDRACTRCSRASRSRSKMRRSARSTNTARAPASGTRSWVGCAPTGRT